MTRQDPPTHKAGKLAVLGGGNLLMTFIVSSLMPASAAIAPKRSVEASDLSLTKRLAIVSCRVPVMAR